MATSPMSRGDSCPTGTSGTSNSTMVAFQSSLRQVNPTCRCSDTMNRTEQVERADRKYAGYTPCHDRTVPTQNRGSP